MVLFILNILRGKGSLVVGARDKGEALALFDGFEGSSAALVPEIDCATG